MRKFLYMAVAAIAALSSCSSDNIVSNENGNGVSNANAPVFTATIEGEGATRTQLVEGSTAGKLTKVAWSNKQEQVFIYSYESSTEKPVVIGKYDVTPGSDATTASLTPSSEQMIEPETVNSAATYGIYPASFSYYIANDIQAETVKSNISEERYSELNNDAQTLILPATQVYNENDISQIAPMMAYSENSSLQFCNITALLAITVPASELSSVQKITISSDKQLNGSFMFTFYNSTWKMLGSADPADETKTLTLDCTTNNSGNNTTIPEGGSKTFYVSIPPRTYGNLKIEVTDGTDTKTMKTKAASITVARNKIYPIAFAENTGSIMNIKVTSADISTLKSIKLVTDQNINGESKEIVYNVPAAQQTPAADGTVYSIEIPKQTYSFYQIYLSADGTTYKEAMASKATVGAVNADINIDYEKNAIQLSSDGPYFATQNACCKPWKEEYLNAWGSAWRLPNYNETTILNGSEYREENSAWGWKYTSTADGYTNASIFFPAYSDAGQYGGDAKYWYAGEASDGYANAVELKYDWGSGSKSWRGCSIESYCFYRFVLR